jgi:hypothetical protein
MAGSFYRIVGLVIMLVFISDTNAQTGFLSGGGVYEFARRSQLLGKDSSNNSFMVRSYLKELAIADTINGWQSGTRANPQKKTLLTLMPLGMQQVYNTHHPFGGNDGSLIPARGVSAKISGGIQLRYRKWTVTLQPELVVSQNNAFETFFTQNFDTTWSRFYQWLNKSDIPERFGKNAYHKLFGGQSSIRYNTNGFSLGISTENLWWGPGTRNALVMSNNAPGFLHFTFNSTAPLQTAAGSFEWQLVAGQLNNSGILPPETNRVYANRSGYLYQPKNESGRYLTGLVVSWQPKWVKGLHVGFAKAAYLYNTDISGMADILPLEGIFRSGSQKQGKKASLGSLFARYVMPEERAEFYMEFGRNDKSPNLINIVSDNAYPRAYTAGFRKLFPARNNSFIEFSSELTQMQLPAVAGLIQNAQSWYLNDYVRQGYTHKGQVLGAAIGPGSNSQMLGIAWVKGIKRVALGFERIVRNEDFYYNAFAESKDFRRHWVDLSTSLSADWLYHRFLISAEMNLTRSLNYQWWYFDYLPLTSPANYFRTGYDVLNFQARVSFSYRL